MRHVTELARNAELLTGVGRRLVEVAGVEPGMRLLDVACGTGNAAIPAAREGARATGLDADAEMLAVARERAADYMVELDWLEGHPRALPFPDGTFDRVVSVLPPEEDLVVPEMRRVCRAGGVVAVAAWSTSAWAEATQVVERGELDWNGRAREYLLAVVRR
jgi:ubiquinone/menaquinone biosynthesis C-methylase UbiE